MGPWLETNGEAVYGTRAGPDRGAIRVGGDRMTLKPGRLFLSMLDWPDDRRIFVEGRSW